MRQEREGKRISTRSEAVALRNFDRSCQRLCRKGCKQYPEKTIKKENPPYEAYKGFSEVSSGFEPLYELLQSSA